jgi:sRNA-binding carbon storage regulator CsrA
MLTLRRKPGQDVYIVVPGREKPVRISVLAFLPDTGHGPEIRLGFDAEDDIEILRHELYEERGNR